MSLYEHFVQNETRSWFVGGLCSNVDVLLDRLVNVLISSLNHKFNTPM